MFAWTASYCLVFCACDHKANFDVLAGRWHGDVLLLQAAFKCTVLGVPQQKGT
jgi:hypothetical protein